MSDPARVIKEYVTYLPTAFPHVLQSAAGHEIAGPPVVFATMRLSAPPVKYSYLGHAAWITIAAATIRSHHRDLLIVDEPDIDSNPVKNTNHYWIF